MTDAPLTLLEVLKRSAAWLRDHGSETPRLDAELLAAHALGLTRLELYLQFDRPLTDDERTRIRVLVRERGRLVPVAYLTGTREFWSLSFEVRPGVLVPRPETELLVEEGARRLGALEAPVFADVGTGSGCIAVSLLHEVPAARAYATDVSADVLEVARRNAERHGVFGRLVLGEGDLLEPVRTAPEWGRIDLVVANPPYVVQDDPGVEAGVRAHEPREALFVSGEDPLEVARRIAEAAREGLRAGGSLLLEIGAGSGRAARAMLEDLDYGDVVVRPDLAKIDRMVAGVWRP